MSKKVCKSNTIFELVVEKQRSLEGKYLGISEDEPLWFKYVNQFSPQRQCGAQFIYEF